MILIIVLEDNNDMNKVFVGGKLSGQAFNFRHRNLDDCTDRAVSKNNVYRQDGAETRKELGHP